MGSKTSAFSYGSQVRTPEELQMRGKLQIQKLRQIALTRDQDV